MSVKLTCPQYAGLKVLLSANREARSDLGGKEVVEEGKSVQFRNHLAEVPDEWMPLIEKHPAYTGARGHEKTIYLWSEVVGIGPDTGVRVITGAVGATSKKVHPPHENWDTMTPKDIRTLIEGWPNQRVEEALYWEMERRRRKGVLTAITDKLAPDPENPQPLVEQEKADKQALKQKVVDQAKGVDPIAQDFEAAIPAGQDGV
jgi:hypothetical protein